MILMEPVLIKASMMNPMSGKEDAMWSMALH